MDHINAAEPTPPTAAASLADDETIAATSDHERFLEKEISAERTHLHIFSTSLGGGIIAYVIYLLLYPPILWLLKYLFFPSATGDKNNTSATSPLSVAMMVFFIHLSAAYGQKYAVWTRWGKRRWWGRRREEEAGRKSER